MAGFKIIPKLILLLGFILTGALFYYREPLKEKRSLYWEKVLVWKEAVFSDSGPEYRRRPISTAAQESQLVMYVGAPFNSFTFNDWQEFWKIIYGFHPRENPSAKWLPGIEKQYTEEELMGELIRKYPLPFAGFMDEHWKMFFNIALKEIHE